LQFLDTVNGKRKFTGLNKQSLKIVVTGPESTGKTELCLSLGEYFGITHMPEYARTYVEGLKSPYSYEDLEHIALTQKNELSESLKRGNDIILMDTYLIITKIWFREVYGNIPGWIDHSLKESEIDLFLVCYYDIPWVKDPVRENPGARRKYLFEEYLQEIKRLGNPFEVVKGTGKDRVQNAIESIMLHFPQLKKVK